MYKHLRELYKTIGSGSSFQPADRILNSRSRCCTFIQFSKVLNVSIHFSTLLECFTAFWAKHAKTLEHCMRNSTIWGNADTRRHAQGSFSQSSRLSGASKSSLPPSTFAVRDRHYYDYYYDYYDY